MRFSRLCRAYSYDRECNPTECIILILHCLSHSWHDCKGLAEQSPHALNLRVPWVGQVPNVEQRKVGMR